MLGPGQPDAFGAEVTRPFRIFRRIGICANAKLADVIANLQELAEVAAQGRCYRGQLAGHNLAGRAVKTNPVAFFDC